MVGREHAVVQDGVGPRRWDERTQPGEKGVGGHLGGRLIQESRRGHGVGSGHGDQGTQPSQEALWAEVAGVRGGSSAGHEFC